MCGLDLGCGVSAHCMSAPVEAGEGHAGEHSHQLLGWAANIARRGRHIRRRTDGFSSSQPGGHTLALKDCQPQPPSGLAVGSTTTELLIAGNPTRTIVVLTGRLLHFWVGVSAPT